MTNKENKDIKVARFTNLEFIEILANDTSGIVEEPLKRAAKESLETPYPVEEFRRKLGL